MCLADPLQSTNVEIDVGKLADPTSFTAFMSSRCRAYIVSGDEADTPQVGYRHHGCNCYSSGEAENCEGILSKAWPHMLAWLDMLYKDPDYAEKVVVMRADMDEELQQAMEGLVCKTGEEILQEDSVTESGAVDLGTQGGDSEDEGVELEAKAQDMKQETKIKDMKQQTKTEGVKQEENMKWQDFSETFEDMVAKAEEPSTKTSISLASEKKVMQAVKAAIYDSDDGYSGDVDEMGSSDMQRSLSVSETDTL